VRRIYARVSHVYDFWAFASHSLRSYSEAQKMKVGLTGRKEELLPWPSALSRSLSQDKRTPLTTRWNSSMDCWDRASILTVVSPHHIILEVPV
jgi:hypothetical protein